MTGAGPVGLRVAQTALTLGSPSVAITDVSAERLAAEARLGFEHTIDARSQWPADHGLGVEVQI